MHETLLSFRFQQYEYSRDEPILEAYNFIIFIE